MAAPHLSHSIVRSVLAAGLAGLMMAPAVARAQSQSQPSLAELARQEAERRKTVKDSKKVITITAKDLPESARKPATETTEQGAAPQAGAGANQQSAPAGNAAPGGQSDEADWRARITQAREGLQRNEIFLQALQTRANSLFNDYRNGAGTFTQQAQVDSDRQKNAQELERVKADVENSRKQVADIEEAARKAGVPPGWLR
jgi:hypothetical protein